MGSKRPRPVVLDAGGLIALERADRRVIRLLELADEIHIPAGALAQVWRNPARQARLSRLAGAEDVTHHPLDARAARAVGQLCAATATDDIVDASVVLVGRQVAGVVVTIDAEDLHRIDPALDLAEC